MLKRLFDRRSRVDIPNGTVSVSAEDFFAQILGLDSKAGTSVTIDRALGVPAIAAAVGFLSNTLASLPLDVYERTKDGGEKLEDGLADILGKAVNDETTSYSWRQHKFGQVFTGGRGLSFVERDRAGRITDLWPLDPKSATIKKVSGRKHYHYRDGTRPVTFKAGEVVDVAFALKSNALNHYSPISRNKDVIGLAIAATDYGSRYFRNGGVPPFAVTGDFNTADATERAGKDFKFSIERASAEGRAVIVLPSGLDIKSLGQNAKDSMLVELKRFCVEEVARIYNLSPIFLQDLSRGTFSNTEQQDLQVVKHTLRHWVKQFEQELNLKLFGRKAPKFYVKLNLDGLLRGDFKTRMEGYARGVQSGIYTPNEGRKFENLPPHEEGGQLMIQSGTLPIVDLPQTEEPKT